MFEDDLKEMREIDAKVLEGIFGPNARSEEYNPLEDRKSSEYKKVSLVNRNMKREREVDPLQESLKEAMHLDDEKKERYLHLAKTYLEDMERNLFRNQFELFRAYEGTSIDEWNDFLSDRIVSVYINKHKRTLLKTAAEDNLADPTARNKRDNLKLIENIKEEEAQDNNKNICIIRLPDIYDEE